MNVLKTILGSVWMIDEATLRSSVPLVLRLMQGEDVGFNDTEIDRRSYSVWQRNNIRYFNYNNAPEGSVAVHLMIGTVTKYGGYCTDGTEDLMRKMSDADNHRNISAHMIEMDSGGGEATNIETVARFIKNGIKKPVVIWFNGVAASAAYYIAAAGDEIYSSEDTDIVGSIGTLITFADFKDYYEKNGIKLHEIYADQSSEKNLDFKEALTGNYKRLKEELLNPYAERFIKTVKEFRPQLTELSAFKGKIFMSAKAIEIGMIDGQKTWEEAAARAAELGKIYNSSNQNTTMDLTGINAQLGVKLEVHDGGVFLTEDQLTVLNRSVSGKDTQAVEQSTLNTIGTGIKAVQTTMTGLTSKITSLETKVTGLEGKITDLETEVEVIGGEAGDTQTKVKAKKDAEGENGLKDSATAAYNSDVNGMIDAAKNWNNPFTGEDV